MNPPPDEPNPYDTPRHRTESGFPDLKAYIISHTGLSYYEDKDHDLAQRVGKRMAALGITQYAHYLHHLAHSPQAAEEMDHIIAELTIGETYFFRHGEQFDALRDMILPDLLARRASSRRLRIWSAGCATGPEACSIAILLKRELGHLTRDWDIHIVATDINQEFLAAARKASFEEWAFRGCPDSLKRECFQPVGKSWVLRPLYRELISFQYHNLVKNPFPSPADNLGAFDLILCRNVMIYFSPELNRRLIGQFEQCLLDGGWFLVGHAEPNLESFRRFRTVEFPGTTLYQKQSAAELPPLRNEPSLAPLPAEKSLEEFVHDIAIPQALPAAAGPVSPSHSADHEAIRLLANGGQWEQALQAAERLLEQEKLDPALHFLHALILEQIDRWEEAELALKRAIYLDREHIFAHYFLGLCQQRHGDSKRAARSYENVKQLLDALPPDHRFPEGDGITAQELLDLTNMHLTVLQTP